MFTKEAISTLDAINEVAIANGWTRDGLHAWKLCVHGSWNGTAGVNYSLRVNIVEGQAKGRFTATSTAYYLNQSGKLAGVSAINGFLKTVKR